MNRKRYGILFGVLVAVSLIIGLSVGLCCKDSTEDDLELVPTPPPNIIAWGEWSSYSSCTVSCGDGQGRMVICLTFLFSIRDIFLRI